MHYNKLSRSWTSALTIFLTLATCTIFAAAQAPTFKVLHSFGPGDGWSPYAALIFDSNGNLYGTTSGGGSRHLGTVFQMKPNPDGTWSETIIHSFLGGDGAYPAAPLVLDSHGNFYGTTYNGGNGPGTVFELTSNADGTWSLKTLRGFRGSWDGATPYWGLTLDKRGHLYGAAQQAGLYGAGVVFELGQVSTLNWYEIVLHAFTGGADGSQPSDLIADASGNLYGTTFFGGTHNVGTVFKLTPNPGKAGWTETVLYSFTGGADGANPYAGVVFDGAGNLYGTAFQGGPCDVLNGGFGTAYKLTPNPDGTWTQTVIYSFGCFPGDATRPDSRLTFDKAGNLYGETETGGPNLWGTVFELTPSGGDKWTETILHSFSNGSDGNWPNGGLLLDDAGNLYGTTVQGGPGGKEFGGVVFEITP